MTRPRRSSSSRSRFARFTFAAGVLAGLATWAVPEPAQAFCGFYVAGADAELYNNATMVVLMRDGTRTVLSMQNNYQGPPQDFAMVVPVPVVLGEDDVKILPAEVFDRVDKLAAPRLVEYWEQDPCAPPEMYPMGGAPMAEAVAESDFEDGSADRFGVTVEAQFEVGEYQVVILSAQESTGLDKWLRSENYSIPQGAESLLRPYVESGSKFFVAKVDVDKVKFDAQGQATLSPLRFHYDSPQFALPVRLGLINAQGAQDLLVHVLARNTRYAVSNYKNVTIPTNLEVKNEVRERFGTFYASLFDHVVAENPQAVVTEYSWAANSCDPCPEPPLTLQELATLGADVLPAFPELSGGQPLSSDLEWQIPSQFVLTRLHARYDQGSLGEDLVFEAAPAIVGGREFLQEDGQLERGAVVEGNINNFQARYIIRHRWQGPVECKDPQYGIWGGPWPEVANQGGQPKVARDLAFVPRGAVLADLVTESAATQIAAEVGELPTGPVSSALGDGAGDGAGDRPPVKTAGGKEGKGCAHCSVGEGAAGTGMVALGLMVLAAGYRRRRRNLLS